jgi:hypothetical protein
MIFTIREKSLVAGVHGEGGIECSLYAKVSGVKVK